MKEKIIWQLLNIGIEWTAFLRKHGYQDKRYLKLKELKNKYQGKRCFICATGPSLCCEDLVKLQNEYTFGVNSICSVYDQISWRPTFYVFQDYPIYEMYGSKFNDKGKTRVLVGDPMVNYKHKGKIRADWVRFPLNWAYHTAAGKKGKPFVRFSDECYEKVYSGYTVTYSAIQLAMYMGFGEIYLLGVDCNYTVGKKNHFQKMKNEFLRTREMAQAERTYQMLAYNEAKKRAAKRQVKIYNASRGGCLEVFPRISLEEVLGDEKKGV